MDSSLVEFANKHLFDADMSALESNGSNYNSSTLSAKYQALVDNLQTLGQLDEDEYVDAEKQCLIESLQQAYVLVDARCKKLDSEIRYKRQLLVDLTRTRHEIKNSLTKFNKSPDSPTSTTTPGPTIKRAKMTTSHSSGKSSAKSERSVEEDDEEASEDEEWTKKGARVSSGACPECGKLRHRDKKQQINTCPFNLWTREFGKLVPRDGNSILVAQKLAWPKIRHHFIDANGQYMVNAGVGWNGEAVTAYSTSQVAEDTSLNDDSDIS